MNQWKKNRTKYSEVTSFPHVSYSLCSYKWPWEKDTNNIYEQWLTLISVLMSKAPFNNKVKINDRIQSAYDLFSNKLERNYKNVTNYLLKKVNKKLRK